MPPKKSGGDKKQREKAKQVLEDRTFGQKNKSKSKKVQQQVQHLKKSLGLDDERKDKKAEAARLKEEHEMRLLFRAAQKKKEEDESADAAKKAAEEEAARKAAEDAIRDEDLPMDERIERMRARLPPGGTRVNEANFSEWLAKRSQRRKAELDRLRATGKLPGLENAKSDLTGKELFTSNSTLFQTAYDADPAQEEAPPDVEDEVDETSAGAGTGAGAGAGVADEANAALFMDEVELDALDDDDEEAPAASAEPAE